MYSASGYYFKELPGFMKPIATVSTKDDFFQAGWWYSESGTEQAKLKGSYFAAAGVYTVPDTGVKVPIAYFADDVAYRTQNQVAYQIVANAILNYASGIDVFFDPSAVLESVAPAAFVTKLSGNQNDLLITVTEKYFDGSVNVITLKQKINNNAAGTYKVGAYKVYVDTKGNTQIRECYIVI